MQIDIPKQMIYIVLPIITHKTTQTSWLSLEWTENTFALLLPCGVALELHYLLLLDTACLHNLKLHNFRPAQFSKKQQ